MTSDLHRYILQRLSGKYPRRRAENLTRLLVDHLVDITVEDSRTALAEECIRRLEQGEPVQYITGYTWFYHLKLKVNRTVLIPRPETEELVHWIVQDYCDRRIPQNAHILDIGTGSGCIALALKHALPDVQVTALDYSSDALAVAQENAKTHGLEINWLLMDILMEAPGGQFDVIVSNPPYVSADEFASLAAQVRDHEPHFALCPPGGTDALVFYRRIAELYQSILSMEGHIYVELNEFRTSESEQIFAGNHYTTELRQDMQGKWRMLRAISDA